MAFSEKVHSKKELAEFAKQDLSRSGLSGYYRKMGIQTLISTQAKKEYGYARPGYKIPYYDTYNKRTQYARARFADDKKPKYLQPLRTLPEVYFPPIINWREVISMAAQQPGTIELDIVEGEKKAFRLALESRIVIGLGGVWCYRSKSRNIPLLKSLKDMGLGNFVINVLFDNDIDSNPDVLKAAHNLIAAARRHGDAGACNIIRIPVKDTKGIDDYLEAGYDIGDLDVEEIDNETALWDFNDQCAYIRSVQKYYDIPGRIIIQSNMNAREHFGHVIDPYNGKPVFLQWRQWQHRRQHEGFDYRPGEPEVTTDDCINLYTPPTVECRKGPVTPFLDLYYHLIKRNSVEDKYFLQWLAHMVARPQERVLSAVLLWSRTEGTGKTLLTECFKPLIGPTNYRIVGYSELLHENFNTWAEGNILRVFNEIVLTNRRHMADAMKDIITNSRVTVHRKNLSPYEVRNYARHILTSNHETAMIVDNKDRRYLIIHVKEEIYPPAKAQELIDWMKNDGAAALNYYFRHTVKLDDFNPNERPPVTDAAVSAQESNKTIIELVSDHIDQYLPNNRDIYRVDEILTALHNRGHPYYNPTSLGRALRTTNHEQRIVKVKGVTTRLWAVRNTIKWKNAKNEKWISNLNVVQERREKLRGGK